MAKRRAVGKLAVRAEVDEIRRAIEASNHPSLAGNQMARRIVQICSSRISEYDLFDRFMSTYGVLNYYDTYQKRSVKLTIEALVAEGLLREQNGYYTAPQSAAQDSQRFLSWDRTPDEVSKQLVEVDALNRIVVDGISTSTSSSCKCTSSSTSCASDGFGGYLRRHQAGLSRFTCTRRVL